VLAENDGLLSLPLSSKGGEGDGAADSKRGDVRKVPILVPLSCALPVLDVLGQSDKIVRLDEP
jgi:hypothetical protein